MNLKVRLVSSYISAFTESKKPNLNRLCKALYKLLRVLKTDLDVRPVYHQKDENTMAHLHLGLLAYWLVNSVRFQLKKEGIHSGWREIVRTMNT